MKMNKHLKIYLTLIGILLFFQSFAQNTFEFTYSQNGIGETIEETSDGDFLLKGNNFVTKTDADGNRTIMKICGQLVALLCKIDAVYKEYVIQEHGKDVLYVHVTRAITDYCVSNTILQQIIYGFKE